MNVGYKWTEDEEETLRSSSSIARAWACVKDRHTWEATRQKWARMGLPKQDMTPPHGTKSRYNSPKWKCRCRPCTDAKNYENKKARHRAEAQRRKDILHAKPGKSI